MKITATAYREDGCRYWTVDVNGVGIEEVTQARHLDEVPTMAAEIAGIAIDRDTSDFDVQVIVLGVEDIVEAWRAARDATEAARMATHEAAASARRAAIAARDLLKTRDAATLLGVNQQRISQLTRP